MASERSLSGRTKEFRDKAADLSLSDRLGSLLGKSFDLLGLLQKDALGAHELDFGLQSLETEFELVKRHDHIPSSPLRSLVFGLVETMHGTVRKMRNGEKIKFNEKECDQLGSFVDDDDSTTSEVGETMSSSEEYNVQDPLPAEKDSQESMQHAAAVAAAVHAPPLSISAALASAAAAASSSTKKGTTIKKVAPSSSISAASTVLRRSDSRPRRSGVKPAGYWSRERSRSRSPNEDDVTGATAAAAAAAAKLRPVLLVPKTEFPLFSATSRDCEVKEELMSEGEKEEEKNLASFDVRGVKRKAVEGCFSDIDDEAEEKEEMPSSSSLSLQLQQLLAATKTPPTVSGHTEGSISTIDDGTEGKKHFRCEICGKTGKHLHNIKSHVRSHAGERRFACVRCGTRFFRTEHLQRHQKGGRCESRPHLCSICGKRFAEEQTLRDHMILHEHQQRAAMEEEEENGEEGERERRRGFERNEKGEYECPHCTLVFKYACHIERHSRTHSGVRPFSCEECGKKFAQLSSLSQHKRIHTGELPYPCTHCERRFRIVGELNVHLRKIHGELLYVCQSCGEKFEKPADLKEHRATRH